jgi:hypothetical protein
VESSGEEEEDDVLKARVLGGPMTEGDGGAGTGDKYHQAPDGGVEGEGGSGKSEDHREGEAV